MYMKYKQKSSECENCMYSSAALLVQAFCKRKLSSTVN